MTWRRNKVARLERQPEVGGLNVVGWEIVRHCGCMGKIGMRLDKHEVTFGVVACDQHEGHVARALDTVKHMPPQDVEIGELFIGQLEVEIGTGV